MKDIKFNNNAYINTDINELCRESGWLGNKEYMLTTDSYDGITLDKQVETQNIYYKDRFASPKLFHLSNEYIEFRRELMLVNMGRCCIYLPFKWQKDYNWFQDDLLMEQYNE